tara:strand:+ start:127 stop:627 length:501 start_codon:yes stop_codon:yes gene_type:complete
MNNNDEDLYILTRGEYAESIGKSKGSVIQAMRRGGLQDQYIYKNGKYYFKAPSRERANKDNVHVQNYVQKKIYRRGNHHKAKYPNRFFQQHNEQKMLKKLNEQDPEFIKNYKEIKKDYEDKKRKEKQKEVLERPKQLSVRMLSGYELNQVKFTPTNRGKKKKFEYY